MALKRISEQAIKVLVAKTADETSDPLYTYNYGVAGALSQLEADQKVFDDLEAWYDRLLEDYKRLKKEGAMAEGYTEMAKLEAAREERERILNLITNKGLKAFLKECERELDTRCFGYIPKKEKSL